MQDRLTWPVVSGPGHEGQLLLVVELFCVAIVVYVIIIGSLSGPMCSEVMVIFVITTVSAFYVLGRSYTSLLHKLY